MLGNNGLDDPFAEAASARGQYYSNLRRNLKNSNIREHFICRHLRKSRNEQFGKKTYNLAAESSIDFLN